MITGLMMMIAYLLPLPIMAACFYYGAFSSMEELTTRLMAIGIVSIAPSAIIMIFVLKRILHLVFTIICIAGVLYGLQHFGLISLTGNP